MKTTPISVAIAAALLAPAMAVADNSSVEIYGRLNLDFENVKTSGATNGVNVPARNRVSSNSSRIGFRGIEDLGGGLKAWFQVEQDLRTDVGTGTLASRNSGVGLNGGFGTLLLGRWDTPYKISTTRLDPFAIITLAGYQNILGQMSTTPSGDFVVRQNNAVQYWTPNWGGFSARLGYSANEDKTSTTNPDIRSAAFMYDQGPFYVSLAYERHSDSGILGGPGTNGDDEGYSLGLGYKFGDTELGFVYERLDYETRPATGAQNLRRDAYFVSVEHSIGKHILRAAVGTAGDQKGSHAAAGPDTGMRHLGLGYGYKLSKRTEIYALYAKVTNENAATYEFGTNTLAGVTPGADSSGVSVGIEHRF